MINAAQEIFTILFSILYGIMLNSLIGLGAFPITSALAGEDACGRFLGKTRWQKGNKSRNRFLLSVFLLNLAPLMYFALTFYVLGDVFRDPPSTFSICFVPIILTIGLLSLSVFAFYYFFFGLAICENSVFYTPYELKEVRKKRDIHKAWWSHFGAGLIYLILPWCISIVLWRAIVF